MAILRVYNPLTQSWVPIPYIKGDKGDRGYDVTTVEYEYYSSTSSSEPTGGEWSTIMPGYSVGRYIWVRTKTTNTHGEVYTGTPVLATLFNDVNSAELTRRTYETNRVNAETARDTAEGLRDSAETARVSAELLRVSAETSRGNSEVSRANAEAQRVSAESSRVSVEAQRVANEEQRISNENARIAAQGRYPIVQNNTWWVWSKEDDDYVDTEVTALGADGVGIASIELTSTVDLVDTYTITFDDGSTTSFDVTNGADGISPTITVTEITGGHEVEVTDAQGTQTFDVMDGEITSDALEERLIDKADVITSSASGEIVTISDGGKDLPVVDLKVSLLPVQDLHGQDAPYPPGGGKNKFNMEQTTTLYCDGSGKLKNNTTFTSVYIPLTASTTYTVSQSVIGAYARFALANNLTAGEPIYNPVSKASGYLNRDGYTTAFSFTFENTDFAYLVCTVYRSTSDTKTYEVIAGTVQVEIGSTATAYAPYSNVCPISGWTGVDVYHSDADTSNPTTYPISWQSSAGTVYGCNIDPVSGVLTVDRASIVLDGTQTGINADWRTKPDSSAWLYPYSITPNYKAQRLNDDIPEIISDKLKTIDYNTMYAGTENSGISSVNYSGSVTHTWGIAVRLNDPTLTTVNAINEYLSQNPITAVYKLEQSVQYQLSETQIATYLGVNNFWSNSNGSIDLEYRADTKLYIEQLTKPSEDDMVANANIQASKFFMVNNRLFLSSVAIAQGETIIPGTNCTEVSLADALNQINS